MNSMLETGATLNRHTATENQLQSTLDNLAIAVLSPELVTEYKRRKIDQVLQAKRPWFAKRLGQPVDEDELILARDWARRHNMTDFGMRFYIEFWGLGFPFFHVVGWSLRQGLPETAPEHVKEKARQILAVAPTARIETEVLMDERRNYDPIVSVSLGAERHCFEVYEEPELERHMF